MIRQIAILVLLSLAALPASSADFSHTGWDDLLHRHVRVLKDGAVTQVDYAGMQREQAALRAYLDTAAGVTEPMFKGWSRNDQLAYLINVYNAQTVALILTRYPEVESIKDLGSFLRSPWKQAFFNLFGQSSSLDHIEHEVIRGPKGYREPRIHVALVCASIGCPGLREEAYTGAKLDDQLTDGLRRFLSDRDRNRYNAKIDRLEVSKIFDWYGEDFSRGDHGYTSVLAMLGGFADLLADNPDIRTRIRQGQVNLAFLNYDWRLNDVSPRSGR